MIIQQRLLLPVGDRLIGRPLRSQSQADPTSSPRRAPTSYSLAATR